MTKRFIALGECMLEMIHSHSNNYNMGFGGDTLNTAYTLSHLSSDEIYYGTAIGTDPYSDALFKFIQANNLHTDFILRDKSRMAGLYFIQTDKSGERQFYYYRDQAAAKSFFSGMSDNYFDALSQFDMLYTTGISLAILNDKKALLRLCQQTKANKGLIAFDNNFRPKLWKNTALARHYFDDMHRLCDILFLSYEDEVLLYHDQSLEETIQRYQAKNIPLVVMTNAKAPTVVIQQDRITRIPPFHVESIIDTTGAGDGFNAGFLQAYLAGQSIEKAVTNGHRIASHIIQHQGALIPQTRLRDLKLR